MNKSRAPVLRSLALVGSLPTPGLIRGPPRDLDPVGSTQYDVYYFAKEIIAGGIGSPRKQSPKSRDQMPSFDPEYACVDLRSGPLELLPYLALTIAEHQIWMNKSSKSQSLDLF